MNGIAPTETSDNSAGRELEVLEKEIELSGVEQAAKTVIQKIGTAIESNTWYLPILLAAGAKAIGLAAGVRNESFLGFLAKSGMTLLQKTIELGNSDATARLASVCAQALLWTVVEWDSPDITRRMLELCVGDFQDLVDQDKDKNAEELVYAAIEVLLAIAETKNRKLLNISLDVFVPTLDQLMGGRFEERTLKIIDGYVAKFRTALPQKEVAEARNMAIVGLLGFRSAVENKKMKVAQHLTNIYKGILQWMFDSGEAQKILLQLDLDNIPVSSATEIVLFDEALLLGSCLLQMETTDDNLRKTSRELVSSAVIQVLMVAETEGKFDAAEAHIESWGKEILRTRPGEDTRENVRYIFEVARDEGVPQGSSSAKLKMLLETIIKKIDGISEVGDCERIS